MGKRLFVIFAVLVAGLGILMVNQPAVNAQECQVVTIHDGEDTITLHPSTIAISKGTCVIWVNWSTTTDVHIAFLDGKKCEDVVEASMDFKLDNDSCFISNVALTKGGTASLVFEKTGTIYYEAKTTKGGNVTGTIIVK
jgi:plastocyanin